jgi:hypothetical protein
MTYRLQKFLTKLFKPGRVGPWQPKTPFNDFRLSEVQNLPSDALIAGTCCFQGILLFDGQKFRQIYPADAGARAVTTILPVASGHLLIGTKKRGALVYDGKTIQELHPTLRHLYVQALAGSDVDLWVGTLHEGVPLLTIGSVKAGNPGKERVRIT